MTGHTKEPWEVLPGVEDGAISIVGSNLGGLVAAAHSWPTEIDSGDTSRIEANARRIPACVNALAGIPDPAAYVAAFDWMVGALDTIAETVNPDDCIGDPWDFYRDLQAVALSALTAARLARGGE